MSINKIFLICAFLITTSVGSYYSHADTNTSKLSVENIFGRTNLEGLLPVHFKISPDGSRIFYLKGKDRQFDQLDLWEFDLNSNNNRILVDSAKVIEGPEILSDEDRARRERLRISSKGIVEYNISDVGNAFVFTLNGSLFYQSLPHALCQKKSGRGTNSARFLAEDPSSSDEQIDKNDFDLKKLTDGSAHETDAHLSSDGQYVSFVRKSNLYIFDIKKKQEIQITQDGSDLLKYGTAEFIAQEEMGRFDGQWWSLRGQKQYLAFTQIDESLVEISKRYEIQGNGFTVYDQRYPRVGTKNVKIKLGVVDLEFPKEVKWLNLGSIDDIYLARVNWLSNQKLAVQIESRDQHRLSLIFYDVQTLESKEILTETDPYWFNLNSDFHFLEKSNQFIWASERSGFKHLYLYDLDGNLIRQLTTGEWPVDQLLRVDPAEEFAYLSGSRESPLEKHLYKISLKTKENRLRGSAPQAHLEEIQKITHEEGWHQVLVSKNAQVYLDDFSDINHPGKVSVFSMDGKLLGSLTKDKLSENHWLLNEFHSFLIPKLGSFKSKDVVELFHKLIQPKNKSASKRSPVLVDVYGGPGHQSVRNSWGGKRYLWHQLLAKEGWTIFSLDNRGSSNRGHAFETAIYGKLGDLEIQDQKAGVEYLIERGIADPNQVGFFGWSYGGFLSLMGFFKENQIFKFAISVAPVTDWTLYDTYYTEKYLSTPSKNLEGYKKSDVLEHINYFSGNLLMIHGMADDNVLFTNSTRLYHLLQERSAPFEMMVYPGSKHGIYGSEYQTHLFHLINSFLKRI